MNEKTKKIKRKINKKNYGTVSRMKSLIMKLNVYIQPVSSGKYAIVVIAY